jgi:hypothetical protein
MGGVIVNLGDYHLADIKDDTKLLEKLKKYEAEISQDFGEPVVLIAYGKNQDSPNPNS